MHKAQHYNIVKDNPSEATWDWVSQYKTAEVMLMAHRIKALFYL